MSSKFRINFTLFRNWTANTYWWKIRNQKTGMITTQSGIDLDYLQSADLSISHDTQYKRLLMRLQAPNAMRRIYPICANAISFLIWCSIEWSAICVFSSETPAGTAAQWRFFYLNCNCRNNACTWMDSPIDSCVFIVKHLVSEMKIINKKKHDVLSFRSYRIRSNLLCRTTEMKLDIRNEFTFFDRSKNDPTKNQRSICIQIIDVQVKRRSGIMFAPCSVSMFIQLDFSTMVATLGLAIPKTIVHRAPCGIFISISLRLEIKLRSSCVRHFSHTTLFRHNSSLRRNCFSMTTRNTCKFVRQLFVGRRCAISSTA